MLPLNKSKLMPETFHKPFIICTLSVNQIMERIQLLEIKTLLRNIFA